MTEDSQRDSQIAELEKAIRRLKLEASLRKNLSSELEKQKIVATAARQELQQKTDELESLSRQLSKYLSPQVYGSIFSGDQKATVASTRKKLTIFFSDLVGFTNLSDTLESEDLTEMLNYYLTEMSRIALDYGGTIDKYVGDAIVIFFGDPETQGTHSDALNCVNMALSMQRRMVELEGYWASHFGLRQPLEMRVGINTGFCTVGNFGSADRLDYTVIGAQVNLASRLESIAEPGAICVSFDTYSQIAPEIECVEVDPVQVKGIREPVRVFEVAQEGVKDATRTVEFRSKNFHCVLKLGLADSQEFEDLLKFVEDHRSKI